MLIRLCPRCNKKIPYNKKYCDSCLSEKEKQKAADIKQYDKHIRRGKHNKKYDDFYHSKEWQHARELAWVRCNGIDLYDYHINKLITPGVICHHIIPIKDDWERRSDVNNLIYLSSENHNIIENAYERSLESKRAMQELLFLCLKEGRGY